MNLKSLVVSVAVLASCGAAYAGGDQWSLEDDNELVEMLARHAAAHRPATLRNPYLGYAGRMDGHQALPPGCTETVQRDDRTGETTVYVDCDPGAGGPPPSMAVPYTN